LTGHVLADEDLITPTEARQLIRVTTTTLRRWEADGTLPAYKLPSGHRRYRRTDIERLLVPVVPDANGTS
jgi:excisionase family DNA binding protein